MPCQAGHGPAPQNPRRIDGMRRLSFAIALALLAAPLHGSEELTKQLKRIFDSEDLKVKHFGPASWMDDGAAYTTVEKDIVRYDTATGKREVIIAAPATGGKPLAIEDYSWSADSQRLLIFTASKKVWRQNTRGDYWVLDRTTGSLKKLGGAASESSLMFAKFSPDGSQVAYVRAHNIYVETLA